MCEYIVLLDKGYALVADVCIIIFKDEVAFCVSSSEIDTKAYIAVADIYSS